MARRDYVQGDFIPVKRNQESQRGSLVAYKSSFWRKRVRVERTRDGVTRRTTVLKTVAITGLHALPQLTINTLAASALEQVVAWSM